jgi:hypothetical protein
LTANVKTMIEWLVSSFMTKLDTKYWDKVALKITFLDTLISKIGTVSTSKTAALFGYLEEKLQEQSDLLRLQSLLDI